MSETPPESTRVMTVIRDLPPAVTRTAIVVAIFLVGGIAGWIGHGKFAGPPDALTMTAYQDWRLLCPASTDKNNSCELSQDVISEKARARVARLVLLKDKDKSTVLAVTVPLEVLLQPGIGIKFGSDQPRVYQYRTCTQEGCVTIIPVDDQMEQALAKTSDAGIIVAAQNGKAVELPFSMKGYVDARHAFLNNEAKRKSWWRRLWS
jgi:invasion protein IalB